MAFLFSAQKLISQSPRATFFTFTFVKYHNVDDAHKAWNSIQAECRRKFRNWRGIRVTEVHPGGHGIHFHCLFAGYIPLHPLKSVASRFGFGDIKPLEVGPGTPHYLAKYLRKPQPMLGRRRKWGMIGGFKGSRVRDIEVKSLLAENCRAVRAKLGVWGRQLFLMVASYTSKFGHVTEWPVEPQLQPLPNPSESLPEIQQTYYHTKVCRLKSLETGEWYSHVLVSKILTPF